MRKKLTALALSLVMLATNISPSLAEKENAKEEVVYVNSKENGDVKDINIVNIFPKGEIKDYGKYSKVKLLNSNKDIKNQNGLITFESDKDRTYYQGDLISKEIPWNIEISYYLNDKNISAKEIKGKNGNIRLRIKIDKNKKIKEDFYDNYALQITTKLDTEKIKNIKTQGATIANEGSKKLITYTSLPGRGIDKEISLSAKDFTYPGFSINAVKLSIDADIDVDVDEKINDLVDATTKLNNGAKYINKNSPTLKSASKALDKGIDDLKNGNIELSKGVDTLHAAITLVENGLVSLDQKSPSLNKASEDLLNALLQIQKSLDMIPSNSKDIKKISEASNKIKDGIANINDSLNLAVDATNPTTYKNTLKENGLDQDLLRNSNDQAINQINAQIQTLKEKLSLADLGSDMGIDNETNENSNPKPSENSNKNQDENQKSDQNTKSNQDKEENSKNKDENLPPLPEYKDKNIEETNPLSSNGNNIKTSYIKTTSSSNQSKDIIREQIALLESTKKLLQANNSNMDATDQYLKRVNESFSQIKIGADSLNDNYNKFNKQIDFLSSRLTDLKINANRLNNAIDKLIENYKLLNQGILSYTNGVEKLEEGNREILRGIEDLSTADTKLVRGSNTLKNGSETLNNGIDKYTDGVGELGVGIDKFHKESLNTKDELTEKIDKIKKSLGDKDVKTKSFASDKNSNIKSLQFVIQTEKIEREEEKTENITDKSDDRNFIEKLKDLFKKN